MIVLEEIIPAVEMEKRWPGITGRELAEFIDVFKRTDNGGKLTPYQHIRTQKTPEGKKIYCCNENAKYYFIDENNSLCIDWGGNDGTLGIVFDVKDIEKIELEHPEYTFPLAFDDNDCIDDQNIDESLVQTASQKGNMTEAAGRARDRKTSERWAEHLAVAVKMACEILKKEDKEYTKNELVSLAEKYGGDWREESRQMKAFRKALPEKYIHGAGAPPMIQD